MSKKRKSINLHLMEGNPNRLTKKEINKRMNHEKRMRAQSDNIAPPDRLNKKQKERFAEIANQLVELEIFDNLNVDALAMYIETYDNYIRVLRSANRMTNQKMDEDFEEYAKRMRVMAQLSDLCRKHANDLGLTISARLKLVIPEKEEEKPESRFARFGADRSG